LKSRSPLRAALDEESISSHPPDFFPPDDLPSFEAPYPKFPRAAIYFAAIESNLLTFFLLLSLATFSFDDLISSSRLSRAAFFWEAAASGS